MTADDLIFTYDIPDFSEIKALMLREIAELGTHSVADDVQQISNTDWYLSLTREPRNYILKLEPGIIAALAALRLRFADIPDGAFNPRVVKYWFQQYEDNDYHTWHNHDTMYAGVAFIELAGGAETQFSVNGKRFSVPVSEGQILLFPGVLSHCSPPNRTGSRKTAIAFNVSG